MFDPLESMVRILLGACPTLSFSVLDIGARPLGEADEFYNVLDLFSGSRIVAFEIDKNLCEELNKSARSGLAYYAAALAKSEGRRKFYETNHPMCSSLYEPNEKLLSKHYDLDVALLEKVHEIDTVCLDTFCSKNSLTDFDFIKIDVQGAELEVFQGAVNSIGGVVAMISEVAFVPIYRDQPLFGEVCSFLSEQGISFHKFLGFAGRVLKPFDIERHGKPVTNHLWADAFFVRSMSSISALPSSKLLKQAFLAFIYGCPDLAQACLVEHDAREGTAASAEYESLLNRLEIH